MSCPSGLVTPENFNTNGAGVNRFFPGSRNYMQEARNAMKLHRLIGMIAVAVPLGALAAVALVVPLAAEHGRNGQLHIVKDCGEESGIPGSDFCTIVSSNLPELPAGTRIYYDLPPGPRPVGPWLFRQQYLRLRQHETVGSRPLYRAQQHRHSGARGVMHVIRWVRPARRIHRSHRTLRTDPEERSVFAWDGTYSFNPLPGR